MEFVIIENEKLRFEAEIKGADHTVCNLLVSELWNDDDVVAAAYNVEHPLTSNPKILIQTKKADAKKALAGAIARLQKSNTDFAKLIEKAL